MYSTADSREVNDSDLEFGPDPLDLPNNIRDEAINARLRPPRPSQETPVPDLNDPEDGAAPRPQSPLPFQGTSVPGRAESPEPAPTPASHSDQAVSGRARVDASPADPPENLEPEDSHDTGAAVAVSASLASAEPRVLYIDVDDDLAALLDRVEETGSPAIVVLPEGARAVRGVVASRLLKRRAEAAGIVLAAVTTDRVTIAQFAAIGIHCSATVGEARLKLRQRVRPTNGRTPSPDRSNSEPQGAVQGPGPSTLDSLDQDAVAATPTTLSPTRAPNGAPVTENHPLYAKIAASQAAANPDPDPEDIADIEVLAAPVLDGSDAPDSRQRVTALANAGFGRVTHARTPGRRRWPLTVFACAFVVFLALSIWVLLFPAATITITYATHAFDHTYTASLGAGPAGSIALHHTELSEAASVLVTGTGTRLVPDGHAAGTVTFANPADGYVLVPAGTVVDAQGGSRYATLADARVPAAVHSFAGSTNGQLSVGVRALTGGTNANVGQGAITIIEGRLSGVLLVINYAPLSGGSMRTVYSVTPADVANAAARLRLQLAAREAATLTARYARSPVRFPGPLKVTAPHITLVSRGGRADARVTITAKMSLEYVHAEDVQALADGSLHRDLAGLNQQVLPGTERITLTTRGQGRGRIVLARVQARTTPTIDVANLRALLVGISVADARRLLDESARNGDWRYTITTRPDLGGRLPQAAGLIDVRVREVG